MMPRFRQAFSLCLIVGLLMGLMAVASSFWPRDAPLPSPGWRLLAPDDAGGLIFRRISLRRSGEAQTQDADSITPVADCCASNAQWTMSGVLMDAAIMCPDAARVLIQKDARYVLVGACLVNADAMVTRPGNASSKIAVMQNRDYQIDVLQSAGIPLSDIVPMFPVGIPYALEKGFVGSGVVDVLTALKLNGIKKPLTSENMTTYVLAASRSFREGPEWDSFARLYDETVGELSTREGLAEALLEYRNLELNREEMELWQRLRVSFIRLPGAKQP
jgi:hypothetical protein